MTAANDVGNVTKADDLTLGATLPSLKDREMLAESSKKRLEIDRDGQGDRSAYNW